MAMSTLESGPKLDWTRDNQMFECYRIWKRKVEFIFCSALSDATPKQLVSYLKYWMGDQGIPLIEKWESTGKLDYSNAEETPATEGGRRRILSSGYKLQTYWDLLDEEFKPKGNKLLSIIELWTRSKQGDKALNQWLTHVYNLVNICKYPDDSTDRIIRDVLIIGCNSNNKNDTDCKKITRINYYYYYYSNCARDKIIRLGEAVTLNQVIEILQTEESTRSTMQQIQEFQEKPAQSVNYVSYDSRSKKSKKPSNEQNSSSSTGSTSPKKRKCFRCGEPFSRKHLQECRAQNVTCDGCGIKGHYRKCCKKTGNFPKDNSNQENQSQSTGNMRYTSAVPLQADYFDERGIHKEYRPPAMQQGSMNILRKVHNPNATILSEDGIEISTSVPTPDFPFTEFPSTEVVIQSQIDSSSISDTLLPRENSNSSSKAFRDTDSTLKSGQKGSSHEEMREIRDPTVSLKHRQSTRDPTTITNPGNSNFRKSTPGTNSDISTSVSFATEIESRSIMPTDDQALMALQSLLSDDFQSKKYNSLQRNGEDMNDMKDEASQLIQKIHIQLQQVQCDLQKLHSLHKYEF